MKKNKKVIAIAIIAGLVFALPLLFLLLALLPVVLVGIGLFFIWKSAFNKRIKMATTAIGVILSLLWVGFLASPTSSKPENGEVAGVQEQVSSSTSSTSSESEEDAKIKLEAEKEAALEQKIATATTVSTEYDTDSSIAAQDVEVTKQANTSIATLGNTTENQELFDVLEVVDGDTIKVSKLGTLRLIGMDTPETKDPRKPVQCFGQEASNKAKELLQGQKVWLEFDPANRIDKYGRTLAYAFRSDGYFFNLEMVREGYANNYTKFPHPRLDEFSAVAGEARNAQKGLFSPTTCNGDSTQAAAKPVPAPVVQQPKPAPVTQKPNPTRTTQQPVTAAPKPAPATTTGFIPGTCKELKSKGLGNFVPGDPNYTASRDGNSDGVACEL